MAIVEEHVTVHTRQKVNYICPYCNKSVNPNSDDAQWMKLRRDPIKRYFHESCYHANGGRRS